MEVDQNGDQVSELIRAVRKADTRTTRQLLENGMDVNTTDDDGDSLLHIAVVYPLPEFIEYLLERGADVNAVRKDGKSIIHSWERGVLSGECKDDTYCEVLELLVAYGARVADVDLVPKGKYLIETIVRIGSVDDARLLLDDLKTRENEIVYNILHGAISSYWAETLEYLLDTKVFDVNETDPGGRTALHIAAIGYDAQSSTLLLENGADPNLRNKNGEAPLIIAVRLGNPKVVDVLLSYRADINAVTHDNVTLLELVPRHHAPTSLDLYQCIIKQVALLECQGSQVNPEYHTQMNRRTDFVANYPIYGKRTFLNFLKVRPDLKEHLKAFDYDLR
ncbi:hypothetical protein QAD02_004390 [Eretmocerus hayati]|uniref:Uncharacterized protein n=1 Tax=Eretmocerus hayati TaxID=131215 RepID=A0ACC2NQM7_9HYME|nr:hypothetical protein QAD02_004390 [Eretmocerus hayati]